MVSLIYIIGGEGFVGSAITRYCRNNGIDFLVINRENYSLHVGSSCDILINANGNSKKYLSREDPVQDFELSVYSVRKTLKDFNFKKYVLFSSCDVYPDCSSPAITSEDMELDIAAQSTYGFHKYLAEQCVRHSAGQWMILRFGGFVGPNMKKNPIYDILNRGPLWLSAESELQYLHTDDAASIVFELISKGIWNEVINVCGNKLARLSDVIDVLGMDIGVNPGSPAIRYDVCIEKLKKHCTVPYSYDTVINFVKEAVK